MPEQARILRFPSRPSIRRSTGDTFAAAEAYLSRDENQKQAGTDSIFSDLDLLLAICGLLKERGNSDPAGVFAESTRIFGWLSRQEKSLGYFDERDYFLGESALLAGSACRVLGNRAETELWLDRADASFRHTINPTPSLSRVAYVRLSLRYDMRRHEEVLELLPSVALTFEKLGMYAELAKCRFLQAMSLKELGRYVEASRELESLTAGPEFQSEPAVRGMALIHLGNLKSEAGDQEEALRKYRAAQPLLEAGERHAGLADLKVMVGETLVRLGQIEAAIDAYREAVADSGRLGMVTRTAYFRIVLSEVLLGAGRAREAEWELLAALPTINEQKMVPEGFAAVALLQQSIKLRKTDPAALAELRKYLQAGN